MISSPLGTLSLTRSVRINVDRAWMSSGHCAFGRAEPTHADVEAVVMGGPPRQRTIVELVDYVRIHRCVGAF